MAGWRHLLPIAYPIRDSTTPDPIQKFVGATLSTYPTTGTWFGPVEFSESLFCRVIPDNRDTCNGDTTILPRKTNLEYPRMDTYHLRVFYGASALAVLRQHCQFYYEEWPHGESSGTNMGLLWVRYFNVSLKNYWVGQQCWLSADCVFQMQEMTYSPLEVLFKFEGSTITVYASTAIRCASTISAPSVQILSFLVCYSSSL